MRLRVIAVGSRMPEWVRIAFEDYAARLRPKPGLTLLEIEAAARGAKRDPQQAIQLEAQRLLAATRKDEYVIALDERGTQLSTQELAKWLGARQQGGRDLAFLIGGPDGFASDVLTRADYKWSLSRLTLPHAMVRVLLAEQLYRAHSVLAHHPYHRE